MLAIGRQMHYAQNPKGYVTNAMSGLSHFLQTFKLEAEVFHNGQYCGDWAIDTSGSSFISFHIVTKGRCYLSSPATKDVIELTLGDMVLFPTDSCHLLSNDVAFQPAVNQATSTDFMTGEVPDSTGLVCGFFKYQHPLFAHMLSQLPGLILYKSGQDRPASPALLIESLLTESRQPDQDSPWVLARIAEALLIKLLNQQLSNESGLLAASLHPKLSAAISTIQKDPGNKWTVDALAERAAMSRSGFATLFKQVAGITPMDYLTQWRLSLAYRRLSDDKISTLEAALEAGYENEASFSKAFKRVLGISPGAVRADAKNAKQEGV